LADSKEATRTAKEAQENAEKEQKVSEEAADKAKKDAAQPHVEEKNLTVQLEQKPHQAPQTEEKKVNKSKK